jgi:hypothetical protein
MDGVEADLATAVEHSKRADLASTRQSAPDTAQRKQVSKQRSSKGRPPNSLVATRQKVLQKIAATGATGEHYCTEVVNAGISTPLEWQKRDGCPASYLDAWNHQNLETRKKFRQRISDEKYKATKRNSPKIIPLA